MKNINEVAIRYLAAAKKTKQEVILKLQRSEFNSEEIIKCIRYLEELGYIDDKDYTKRYISQSLRLEEYSIYEIKFKLLQKGINKYIINEELEKIDSKEYEQVVVYKIKSSKMQQWDEEKLINYLRKRRFNLNFEE